MWHVSSRSGVATLQTAIHLLLTYFTVYWKILCTPPYPQAALGGLSYGLLLKGGREGEENESAPAPVGGLPPVEKLPPLGNCMRRPITCPSYAYTLLERSYSTRTTMKRTNFPPRFDKLDLNFEKVYTHSQSSGHIQKS